MIDLIYCAGGNARLSQIAHEEGWLLGFRSDKHMGDFPVSFVDVDYKKPDFERHMDVVSRYRPKYATIPDLSEIEISCMDIDRALRQYERLAHYCEIPLLVPKLSEQLEVLPRDIAIGYSIPSSYGGAKYSAWELEGRHIHLLGGSPSKQWQAFLHLNPIATVMSADCNYAQKQAVNYAMYWKNRWLYHPGKAKNERDLYLECWRWSCKNIRQRWIQLDTM